MPNFSGTTEFCRVTLPLIASNTANLQFVTLTLQKMYFGACMDTGDGFSANSKRANEHISTQSLLLSTSFVTSKWNTHAQIHRNVSCYPNGTQSFNLRLLFCSVNLESFERLCVRTAHKVKSQCCVEDLNHSWRRLHFASLCINAQRVGLSRRCVNVGMECMRAETCVVRPYKSSMWWKSLSAVRTHRSSSPQGPSSTFPAHFSSVCLGCALFRASQI